MGLSILAEHSTVFDTIIIPKIIFGIEIKDRKVVQGLIKEITGDLKIDFDGIFDETGIIIEPWQTRQTVDFLLGYFINQFSLFSRRNC